jgi:hypothetical protein
MIVVGLVIGWTARYLVERARVAAQLREEAKLIAAVATSLARVARGL